MSYDEDNIFAKIIRGEIACDKIYEDEFVLSFKDIRPQAPSHALIIPKGNYLDINDFSLNASDNEIIGFNRAIAKVADMLCISENSGGNGYRVIANAGNDAHQEVPHLHFHLLAGRPLGPMVFPEKSN